MADQPSAGGTVNAAVDDLHPQTPSAAADPPTTDSPAASSAADSPAGPASQAAGPSAEDPVSGAPASAGASPAVSTAAPAASTEQLSIDELLARATFDDPSSYQGGESGLPDGGGGDSFADAATPDPLRFQLPSFNQLVEDAAASSIDLLRDVELNVKIELGRSRMLVEDVLKLSEGSVVELDKLAGDPVDVFVNDRLVARGEVLVLNDNFCVRVNEIMAGAKEEGL